MQRYLVTSPSYSALRAQYFYDPADTNQSTLDYLEEKLDEGYELTAMADDGGNPRFVFRVVAK